MQVKGRYNGFEFAGGQIVEKGESNESGAEIFGVAKSERADELQSEGGVVEGDVVECRTDAAVTEGVQELAESRRRGDDC